MPKPRVRTQQAQALLDLVRQGRYDRRQLAGLLGGMPSATLDRLVRDLRDEGHPVVAIRRGMQSFYMLLEYPHEPR